MHAHATFYHGMARVQTNQMKATAAIYVLEIYGYNSHLIGWHPRQFHS